MAVKPSSDLLKLEEQLTCPVCLDLYTNPKTLPCLHSFCQECLEGLPQEREARGDTYYPSYYLSCPTCRQRTEVPREGVGAFPVAFHLNNLKEITQSLKSKVSDPQQVTCNDHGKPLDTFCVTCETVICHYCAFRTHEGHKHALISDCYPKHYQMLHDSLKPVKGKKEALKKVLSDIGEREGQIRERGEGVLEEIHQMVEEMMNVLCQSERKLTEQVKRVTDVKLQVLSGQTKSVQTGLNLVEDVEDYVEQSLKTGTHQQVLSSKKQMMERLSEVTTQIDVEELRPIEKDDLRLIKESAETLKSLHHIGTVSYTALQECKVKIFEVEKSLKENKVSFSLSMEGPDLSLVSVPVSSLRCSLVPVGKGDEPIHTTVTTTSTHPGVYRIHYNPSTHGTHTVKVQVYDVQLEDTSVFSYTYAKECETKGCFNYPAESCNGYCKACYRRKETRPCHARGCDFFGKAATKFYCSQCFKKNFPNILNSTDNSFLAAEPSGDTSNNLRPNSGLKFEPPGGLEDDKERPKCTNCREFYANPEYSQLCSTCFKEKTKNETNREKRLDDLPPIRESEMYHNRDREYGVQIYEDIDSSHHAKKCETRDCFNYAAESCNGYCRPCYRRKFNDDDRRSNSPLPKAKIFCRTAGCSFHAVPSLENYCDNCYYKQPNKERERRHYDKPCKLCGNARATYNGFCERCFDYETGRPPLPPSDRRYHERPYPPPHSRQYDDGTEGFLNRRASEPQLASFDRPPESRNPKLDHLRSLSQEDERDIAIDRERGGDHYYNNYRDIPRDRGGNYDHRYQHSEMRDV